jgi:iron complex transport system ATP-binding protein
VAIKVTDLGFRYGATPILKAIHMTAREGEITAIIGPNAAGKSTLLKCLAGILKPTGKITLNDISLKNPRDDKISRSIGYLPQESIHHPVLTVFEVVLLGRIHSLSWQVDDETLDLVVTVMEEIGIGHLASKNFDDLSGGEKQLVLIAQLLIQSPKVVLMDEPIGHLDLQHQIETLDLLREATRNRKIITLIVLHDLSTAARYADNLIVMKSGTIHAAGTPSQILTAKLIGEIYRINARILDDGGTIHVLPICSLANGAHGKTDPIGREPSGTKSDAETDLPN